MVSRKGKTADREILDKLIQFSKEKSLGADYYDLLSSLEERINEQYLENQSLREDIALDSEYIGSLQKELNEIKEKGKPTKAVQEEMNLLSKEAEDSKFHAKQLEKGIQYLRCKLDEAKTDNDLINEELLQYREEIETLRLQLEEARKGGDQGALEQRLEENREELSVFEKEIEALKQGVLRTIQEVKELAHRFEQETSIEDAAEEHEENLQRLIAKQEKQIEEFRQELETKQKRCQELDLLAGEAERQLSQSKVHESEKIRMEERCKELEKSLHEVFQKGEEAAKNRIELEQKIRRLEEEKRQSEKTVQNRSAEKEKLEEQLALSVQKIRECEEETKIAQQHLAKKLKDYTVLMSEHEELKKEALASQAKINELRSSLQAKQNIEIALKNQLKVASKFFEEEKKKSEEHLQKNASRLNELESRCQDLQGIEEKYQKLQEMIRHFSFLLDHERKNPSS